MNRIESFFLHGPSGRIECMLKRPGHDTGVAAAVVCHPHPLFGGTMHNKVVHAAAESIVEAGLPVLRFNFRGVGGSGGAHDGGRGEQDDLRAVIGHLTSLYAGRPLLLVGYSFGAFIALAVGCGDPRAEALIGIGMPVSLVRFDFLRGCAKPVTLIQGDQDAFGTLEEVLGLAALVPGGGTVAAIHGAAHNFDGRLDELARKVADSIPDGMRRMERPGGPVGEDPQG
jgi:uncharacterized protein